ncbi:MAG: LuxR C-terminal-related transcriptional regulator [Spirochaetia bacterium]|nr:LuxR C-terminal-related transcriptional regulator [Spirochaetia bacterium]
MKPLPILKSKLYTPPPAKDCISRSRLIARMNKGIEKKVTVISAAAGSGKSILLSQWLQQLNHPTAMLSLDERDSDPLRFLSYLSAALKTIEPDFGKTLDALLMSPQPPSLDALVSYFISETEEISEPFTLVLDDYHNLESTECDTILQQLIDYAPPQMHLTISSREDPPVSLGKLRADNNLLELRIEDLHFTLPETGTYFNHSLYFNLQTKEIETLFSKTEGWIAGLHLAAVSMQNLKNRTQFIENFNGTHSFIVDYLMEEVLSRQPKHIQNFLLQTSILSRLSAPLCEAVVADISTSGKEILDYLAASNLFLIPLDTSKDWFRYHHLFGELLRQKLTAKSGVDKSKTINKLHIAASQWYETNGYELDAFFHAAESKDIPRAAKILAGGGIPLHLRGGLQLSLDWFASLSTDTLNQNPILWILYSGALTTAGKTTHLEEKLNAAESAVEKIPDSPEKNDLLGRIASNRAVLALSQYKTETILSETEKALVLLSEKNIPVRNVCKWSQGVALHIKGDLDSALKILMEALRESEAIQNMFIVKLSLTALGNVLLDRLDLYEAEEYFKQAVELFKDDPLPISSEVYLGMAYIYYQRNQLDEALRFTRKSIILAKQFSTNIDRYIINEEFLSHLTIAVGEVDTGMQQLKDTLKKAEQNKFILRIPDTASSLVKAHIIQNDIKSAELIAQKHPVPLADARLSLANHQPDKALSILRKFSSHASEKGLNRQLISLLLLESLAFYEKKDEKKALQKLKQLLTLTESAGIYRFYLDEQGRVKELLQFAAENQIVPGHTDALLDLFRQEELRIQKKESTQDLLLDSLSAREVEILQLIAEGLSNKEIAEKLGLALNTIKGHNRHLFDKLGVQRRTEAVAWAREAGMLD